MNTQRVTYGVGWALVAMVAGKEAMVATISVMQALEWLTVKSEEARADPCLRTPNRINKIDVSTQHTVRHQQEEQGAVLFPPT